MTDQQQPQTLLFTCLACQVGFSSAELQRNHYVSDWHRYNLKRKVVDLSPVTLEVFTQKVLAQQRKNQIAIEKENFSVECGVCNKIYYSNNAYVNHLKSNKHKVAETRSTTTTSISDTKTKDSLLKNTSNINVDDDNNDSQKMPKKEQEIKVLTMEDETSTLLLVDKKIETSIRLGEMDCLFCAHKSDTFDDNITHMAKVHSFFIPEVEYLVNIRGLIKYLGEKISVGNVCLYCNGRGKGFQSLEAVRKHMIDKGHTMIIYDQEDDIMEISDYYDFRSSYSDLDIDDDNDDEDELPKRNMIYQDKMELVLPSGARIGHRSLARYYKQNLRFEDNNFERNNLVENDFREGDCGENDFEENDFGNFSDLETLVVKGKSVVSSDEGCEKDVKETVEKMAEEEGGGDKDLTLEIKNEDNKRMIDVKFVRKE
ncbi:11191_t:CDS:10 [Entrophospora sp. SA101]|nr:11191_t:CDS:10 [Entrophospora sp. SA101]